MQTEVLYLSLCQPKRKWRAFLGMAGYCHVWISDFVQLAKPLFEGLNQAGERVESNKRCGGHSRTPEDQAY